MDKQLIDQIIAAANSDARLHAAQLRTAVALGLENAQPPLHNGCAATLSALLISAGVEIPFTLGAGHLAQRLGGSGSLSRRWQRIDVGEQQAGDVGVTYDLKSPPGADHIYLVAERLDADAMRIADNQQAQTHTRYASGKDKTPTAYFLRPSGLAIDAAAPAISAVPLPAHLPAQLPAKLQATILEIAAHSEVARYDWPKRGVAPAGYIKGMALAFAKAYHNLSIGDATAVAMAAAAQEHNTSTDALAWYHEQFAALGMQNDKDGADTLRHLYVLLTGLGMRESSGRYCEGRDKGASNTAADTAEAGLFQSSYNLIGHSAMMSKLFASYAGSTELLSVFQEGVHCKPGDLENHGSEKNGLAFQQLSKSCPAFAVELAALGLRLRRQLWGPINGKSAELRFECDWMLQQVQHAVKQAMQ
ncbi:hypothetical protein [Janthinobacterium sp.]|uniref:hypothetical protein n=1 Tax=Janthinobacterium sp. TaxID=1871054 RepID=UPI00258D3C78|nr:hypothetical protein [Janthinobacterium sp.]MCX7294013.1 hypothetical protein [Janthinobacterium sp.]